MTNLLYHPRHPFASIASHRPEFEMMVETCQEFARQRYKDPYSYGRDPYVPGLIFQPTPLGQRILECIQLADRQSRSLHGIERHPQVDCLISVLEGTYAYDCVFGNFANDREVVVTTAVLTQSCRHLKEALGERSLTSSLNRYPVRWKNDEIALSKMFKLWLMPQHCGVLNVVFVELHHVTLPNGINPYSRDMVEYIGDKTKTIIDFLKTHFKRGFLGGAYKLLGDSNKHMLGLFLAFNGAQPHCYDPVEIGKEIGQYFQNITMDDNVYINHTDGAVYDQGIGHIAVEERQRSDYLMQAIHDFVYADYYASLPTNVYGGTRFGIINNV